MSTEPENKQKSDLPLGWKKAEIVASILASIALPLILGFGGWWVNKSINERELRVKYIDIAAKVLQLDQLSSKIDQSSVRDWAFQIINNNSQDTPIADSAKIQLTDWFTFIGGNDDSKPDYKIFLCESNISNSKAKAIGTNLIKKMIDSYDVESNKQIYQVGWIETDVWTDKNNIGKNPLLTSESLKGKITIIANPKVDNYNPQGKHYKRIHNWIKAVNARLNNDDDQDTKELKTEEVNDDKKTTSNPTEIIICFP